MTDKWAKKTPQRKGRGRIAQQKRPALKLARWEVLGECAVKRILYEGFAYIAQMTTIYN